jgi:hypothetical protein
MSESLLFAISATFKAWANATRLASEKSEGWSTVPMSGDKAGEGVVMRAILAMAFRIAIRLTS